MTSSKVRNYKRKIDYEESKVNNNENGIDDEIPVAKEDSTDDHHHEPLRFRVKRRNSSVPSGIKDHLMKFVDWFSAGRLKSYFYTVAKMSENIDSDIIVIDSDSEDNEVSIIGSRKIENKSDEQESNPFHKKLKNQTNSVGQTNSGDLSLLSPQRNQLIGNNFSLSTTFGSPFSSSTPNSYLHYKTSSSENHLHNEPGDSSLSYKPTNGAVSADGKDNQVTQPVLPNWQRRPNNVKYSAPVTNPDTDVEILLDFCKMSTKEPKEIEILSQISTSKQCSVPSENQQPPPLRAPYFKEALASSVSSNSPTRQQQSVSNNSRRTSSPYTAHTVVRLHEKEQYRWLLDHCIRNGSHYRPAFRKPQSQNAEVQVDFPDKPIIRNSFKREKLNQPINTFLEKYYKPCQLVTPDTDSKAKESAESENIAKGDDEVQILEVRLPMFEPKFQARENIFSSDWIEELKIAVQVETNERIAIVEEQERELQHYREERIRDQLKLSGTAVCELEPKEDVLPVITAEMEDVIESALESTSQNDRLCSLGGQFHILRKDMDTLSGLNWLNDEVINYYLALIVHRSKDDTRAKKLPSVYAFNSFFYPSLKLKGYSGVKRWTRRVDIFAHDLNLVPLHLGVHWCLAVMDHRIKKIRYYDSMGSGEDQCLEVLWDYLFEERKDKKSEVMDQNSYSVEIVKDIPQQMNGSDCGMFTLKYAEYITRDAPITFTQKEMQYFRRRMVYELLTNKICE